MRATGEGGGRYFYAVCFYLHVEIHKSSDLLNIDGSRRHMVSFF